MTGIYIHVPFCRKRCTYCNFYSTTHGKSERDAFVRSLIREMRFRRTDERISTIYFGGGTPSQLDARQLDTVFQALRSTFDIDTDAEITFEANPDDIDAARCDHLARLGVNRVSLGVQSFDDHMLRRLNRRHNSQQASEAVAQLRAAGIRNLSLDLIFGLPTQNLGDWSEELRVFFTHDVQHLSAYALTYEPGTPLYRARARGEVSECDEETFLAMFDLLIRETRAAGLEQYEISNFARPGHRSRHNSSYWSGVPYLGFGPGAHSFDGQRCRRFNLHSLSKYIASGQSDAPTLRDVPHTLETLTDTEHYNEVMMTRLRTAEGIDLHALCTDCGKEFYNHLLHTARPHLDRGNLEMSTATSVPHLRLSPQGMFISDDIMSDLIHD